MKKLLTTVCFFAVTTIATLSFIAPTVFGQEKKTAKANPSPAKSVQQAAQSKAGIDPERLNLVGIFMIQQNIFEFETPNSVLETFMAMTYAAIAE